MSQLVPTRTSQSLGETLETIPFLLDQCFCMAILISCHIVFFFQYLSAHLADAPGSPVTGSDDEGGMRKAISFAFPKGASVSCTRHLKTNLLDYLKDTIGMPSDQRQHLISSIFGQNGLAHSDNSIIFDIRLEDTKNLTTDYPRLQQYLDSRLIPLLRQNMKTAETPNLLGVDGHWTNNNCESLNHVLKQATDWKYLRITDLITTLHDVVQGQQRDLERALIGRGDYKLCDDYKNFFVNPSVWASRDAGQRHRHFMRFLRKVKEGDSRCVRSSDGQRVVIKATHGGKKPGQVKRKRTAKTTTTTNKSARRE